MKMKLVVKQGIQTLAEIDGIIDPVESNITLKELNKTIEVEQWLERVFGLRFHINQAG